MPRTLPPAALQALRAQIAFLHDLGIHDLYRRPLVAEPEQGSAPAAMPPASPPSSRR